METVSNLASSASRAIWGDQITAETATKGNETAGKEPIAGETGNVKAGEPYDKGNLDTTSTSTEPAAALSTTNDPSNSTSLAGNTVNPEPQTNKTGITPLTTTAVPSSSSPIADTESISPTTTTTPHTQGTDKPISAPIRETKNTTEQTVTSISSGPGPTSLDSKTAPKGLTPSRADDGPQRISPGNSTSTGETSIKSAGLGANGAAKEADRSPAQKGVNHTPATGSANFPADEGSHSSPTGKERRLSLKEKIKAKLHKH